MAEKIKISDLFDFSDVQDLQELYKRLEQINQIYKELAKNISQESKVINKGLEENVKEVEQLAKALKGAGDSADIKKLSDAIEKQAEVNKKLTAQNEKLTTQNLKLKQSQKEVNEEGKEAARLLKEQDKLKAKITAATGEEAKQNAILKLELQRVNKETKEQAKQLGGLENAYQKLVREQREAKNEAKRLGAELGTTSTAFLKAQKNAQKLDTELKELDASVGDFQRNVGNYESALGGIGQGFSSVLELATPAGLALAGVALAIEGIGALAETVAETNQQLKETSQLTGLTGDQLTTFTSQVRTTAKVFEQDYKEVLRSANAVSKEFGITGAEAIDLINNGFVRGANINDDYLDQLREFSTQAKEAKISTGALNEIIVKGAQEGVFADKLIDSLKEGKIKLSEFKKETQEALQPLGELRNEQIKTALASDDVGKAIQLVAKGLKEVDLNAKETQELIAGVFGGPGEDAGLRGLKLFADIDLKQKDINANLTEQQRKQLEILKVEEQLANAEVRLGEAFKNSGKEIGLFFTQLQTLGIEGILSVIEDVKEGFTEVAPLFSEAGDVIDELAESLGLTGSGFVDFLKKFNPITNAIKNTVLVFKVFLNAIIFIVDITKTYIDVLKELGKGVFNFITSFDALNEVVSGFSMLWSELLGFFAQTPQFLTGLQNAFFETFKQINAVFRGSLISIRDGLTGLFNLDLDAIKAALAKGESNFINAGGEIAKAFKKGFEEQAPITTAIKSDTKKADEVLVKAGKEQAAKTDASLKLAKDKQDKALTEKLKAIDDAATKEEIALKDKRLDGLITEQDYQDELLTIQLRRLEELKEAQEKAGISTLETEQQIQNVLLSEQKKGEKLSIEQQKAAAKESEKIKKAEEKKKLRIEKESLEARKERANDPLAQAGFDALEGKIKNDLVLAGVVAFRSSLENGDDVQTALQNGTKAVAAGQLFKTLSGFHDGGYTGEGNEYDVAGVVHKGEHVITKAQTNKYGLKGLSATQLDNAIDTGYFRQFESTNNELSEQMQVNKQIVLNNNNDVVVSAINDLPKKMPKTDFSFYGKDLQQRTKTGNVSKTQTFRGVR